MPPGSDPTETFDLIVLGSGAAGLTAALTAALEGGSVLVVEHAAVWGGTTARSSGTVWIPDNRAMRAAGRDDRDAAEAYLDGLVGDLAPREMRRAFLDAAPAMEADLTARSGLALSPMPAAPDYRQDVPGAAEGWRAMAPGAFDGRRLGPDFATMAAPLPELMLFGGMMLTRPEAARLVRADRSISAALHGARLTARFLADRATGHARGTRLVLGNALAAHLFHAARVRGVTLRTGVETLGLLREGGAVVGVAVRDGAGERRILARRGVVLAGGGFPASPEWRARELPNPTPEWTPAAPGAVGRTIELGLEAGGALGPAGRDNALWFPSSIRRRADGSTAVYPHIVLDRSKPGGIAVDASGRRFVNEAVSYHEFVRAMYAANSERASVPAWLVCGREFIRRYGLGLIRPRPPSLRACLADGYLIEGRDARDLAKRAGIDPEGLAATLGAFDAAAARGEDPEFGRGSTIYDRSNGDPEHGPNPCLGPVGAGPLYAVKLWPTPLGTSRGLATDVAGRALDGAGAPIPGLYVCGNDMQSAFGGEYPGAGAQLGQGMTFGWLAARHAMTGGATGGKT
ncbi:FAD-dependent oxidoreductase [Albimonas pacifica]|uniref:Succinate dehydrogenase/fumarate reductase, flavoprotein subunit n=1 Tax=Albimonas pacifica TaxID=1114924 RepID=A0A1I3FS66_9RHOB|nr:FAD-dependent oxidoreductase [Albimonas pacifica]SFI14056.1 Succinate dehydrogenase/fumarate reductase, flavoprotein subunit [Albimonas pacifica]